MPPALPTSAARSPLQRILPFRFLEGNDVFLREQFCHTSRCAYCSGNPGRQQGLGDRGDEVLFVHGFDKKEIHLGRAKGLLDESILRHNDDRRAFHARGDRPLL